MSKPLSSVAERFLKYVRIHSDSKDDVTDRFPSTPEQLEIARVLKSDLEAMGLKEITLDQHGYLFATLPGNLAAGTKAPVIGLLAHVDTYPGVSGKDVKPILHHDYDGSDLKLPGDAEQIIRVKDNPELLKYKGQTIITSDGTTLLGADDKAGIAEILEAVAQLQNSHRPRPTLRIGFTPDEEVGAGTKYFDLKAFGADVAYTVDGGDPEVVEDETFCADTAIVTITGRDVHPGYAKGKMINALRIAARLIDLVAPGMCAEYTEKRQGYLHPVSVTGDVSQATVRFIVRDFAVEGLKAREKFLSELAQALEGQFAGAKVNVEIKESYRNMKYYLDKDPRVVAIALRAVKAVGLEARGGYIRGGTDGSQLSAMGLPTPNIGGGGKNFHSKQEWIAEPVLEMCTKILVELVHQWASER